MKVFTVHVRRFGINPEIDVIALKEGFNFWAFLFTFIWSLFKGYWLLSLLILLASFGVTGLLAVLGLDLFGQAAINLAFNILVGFYANDMARWTLGRRGYMQEEILTAQNADQAVEHYIGTGFA